VGDDATADPGAERYENHVLEASSGSEAERAPGGCVSIVLYRDRQTGSAAYLLVQTY
jgi:hypothetical protein